MRSSPRSIFVLGRSSPVIGMRPSVAVVGCEFSVLGGL